MPAKSRIFKILPLLFCLGLSSVSHATVCADHLDSKRFTFDKFNRILTGGIGAQSIQVSSDEIKRFWKVTWVHLVHHANEEGMSVSELLSEGIEILDLSTSVLEEARGTAAPRQLKSDYIYPLLASMENWSPQDKLKKKQWAALGNMYMTIKNMGLMAVELEKLSREHPTFNPFDDLTPTYIDNVFRSLEDSSLSRLGQWQRRILKQREESEEARVARELKTDDVTEESEVEEVDPPLSTDPSPDLEQGVVVESFVDVIREQLPFDSDIAYRVETVGEGELSIEFSKEVAKESSGNYRPALFQLLRALVLSANHRSGLKKLYDLGPQIVEVKARMNGHRRLIGCLQGKTLVIKKFMDIKGSVATYAKRIPSNLCSE